MIRVGDLALLRRPEPRDAKALYDQKNDREVAGQLGGHHDGYAAADIDGWIERHRNRSDEVIWVIADPASDACWGHVGLYRIDHRIGSAEFAILLGEKSAQGRGVGKAVTAEVVRYGFEALNLHRIELTVLATNGRAIALYEKLGFVREGLLRQAQFKEGRYVDVLVMGLLRSDRGAGRP